MIKVNGVYTVCNRVCTLTMVIMFPFIYIRLVGASNTREGRVELYNGSTWSTICNYGSWYWDNTDAGVVCRQLGLGMSGTAASNAEFGQGSGTIQFGGYVFCYGTERDIKSCPIDPGQLLDNNCHHNHDAGVRCGSGEYINDLVKEVFFHIYILYIRLSKV